MPPLQQYEIKQLLLGRTAEGKEVHLLPDDRETGIHIIGTSRRGKSKQIEFLERQKVELREGGLLIDPHGELYPNMERWLAANQMLLRRRKIRFIDPADPGVRFGINPLRVTDASQIPSRAYAMLAAFSKMWGSENLAKMPTFQRCFVGLVYALISKELTLLELHEAIPANRKALRSFLREDLPSRAFDVVWADFEVLERSSRDWRSEFGSTMNRVTQFLTSDVIQETVGQRRNVIDWRACMDEGEYIVLNLANFTLPHAQMLGRLIIHELFDVALQRPKTARRPFHLTIDECAAFLSDDIPKMLPQTAKFGLHLTLAHQYLGQLKEESELIYAGVMEQAPTKIVFGLLGYEDARVIAPYILAREYDFERPKHVLDKPVVVGQGVGTISNWSEAETETAPAFGGGMNPWTISRARAEGTHEVLIPEYATMPTAVYSKDEIEHLHATEIMSQLKRHALFRPSNPSRQTVRYQVPEVEEGTQQQRRIDALRQTLLERTGFMTVEQAKAEIDERRAQILLPLIQIDDAVKAKRSPPEAPPDPESWRE